MTGFLAFALALSTPADSLSHTGAAAAPSLDIGVDELKGHVYLLASPEFMGRKGPGAARASRYLAEAFKRLQLEPAFGDSFFQPIPWLLADDADRARSFIGRNVGAVLPGTDPSLKDEWILLCAHYDHLGQAGGRLFPGADDNASGVAMLLEVAERLARQEHRPRRTIMFVAFDQEEAALMGSRHFATHPPRSIKSLKACLVADMLGRSMANLMDEYVFALGSEHSQRLRALLEEVKPTGGLRVARVGADLIGTRSDYGPFRDRQIPFLFVSTGQHPDYHQPTDLPEKIDYVKLREICLWISELTRHLANDDEAPAWEGKELPPDLDEVRTVLVLVSRTLERSHTLSAKQREVACSAQERLAEILKRGKVTSDDRTWLVWTARLLMATLY